MTRLSLKSNQDRLLELSSQISRAIFKSWMRQIWDRLPESLVSILAIGIFGALFFHVFVDIFSPDIAALAPRITTGAALTTSLITFALGGLGVYKFSRSEVSLGWWDFVPNSHGPKEVTKNTMFFIKGFATTSIAVGVTAVLWSSGLWKMIAPDVVVTRSGLFLLCLVAYGLAAFIAQPNHDGPIDSTAALTAATIVTTLQKFPLTGGPNLFLKFPPLARWRFGLLVRTPLTWTFWAAGLAAYSGFYLAAFAGTPGPFLAVIVWLAGWIASLPQAFQAATESESVGFEKGLGITHHLIARSHYAVASFTTALCGIFAVIGCVVCGTWDSALAVIAAAMIPGSLMTGLLWQIDVRRPLVQVVTSLMSSLFLATAVIASKTALMLWPVVLIYLFKHQAQRIMQLETHSSQTGAASKGIQTMPARQEPIAGISIRGLKVTHGDPYSEKQKFELGPLTLEVAPGSCLAVLGPNGSGKSTFFQTLTGNLKTTSGTISIHPEKPLTARLVGYLPQQNNLPPWATARELCQFSADLSGTPAKIVSRILKYWDCTEFENTPTAKLSTGMRKRVGLGIATLNNPAILILDEPFEALDLGHIAALKQEIINRNKQGLITIFATHIASYAAELATAACFFEKGQVAQLEWPQCIEARHDILKRKFNEVAPPPSTALHGNEA